MVAFSAIVGTLGAAATVVESLREVLKGMGVDPKDITRIIGELAKRPRGGRSGRQEEGQDPCEYSVVTLSERRLWGRSTGVVPSLRDGVEIPSTDLATYLNQLSAEGWKILSCIGSKKAPTMILVRCRPAQCT